jgi:hypothetical protein
MGEVGTKKFQYFLTLTHFAGMVAPTTGYWGI